MASIHRVFVIAGGGNMTGGADKTASICRVFVVQGREVRIEQAGGADITVSINCVFATQTEQLVGADLMASIRRVFTVRRRRNMNRRGRRDR